MTRPTARLFTALLATTGLVLGLSGPAGATAATESDARATAMQRDLNLTKDQISTRLRTDAEAGRIERSFTGDLGRSYAGTWVADGGSIVVATTDRGRLNQIRAAGAEPKLVTHSLRDLGTAKSKLDTTARPAADAVAGWYVDSPANRVVVAALPGGEDAAKTFVSESGAEAGIVEVAMTDSAPRLFDDVRGGDAYYPGGFRCSVGFAVEGGFVTAGHCGSAGTLVDGHNQATMGSVEASSFPGNDFGWVGVNSDWTSRPWVNDYAGGNVTVSGSQEASVGASICRSGSTTGWHCGQVQAKDQTVNYAEGTVFGLTRTSVCAEPGDSGGSYISGSQAQGVTSGGSGNCSRGGTTFFQPVNEILQTYSLSLTTG